VLPTGLLRMALDMGIDYRIQPRHKVPTHGYGGAILAEDMSIDTSIKGRCKNKQKRRQKQRISKASRRKNRS